MRCLIPQQKIISSLPCKVHLIGTADNNNLVNSYNHIYIDKTKYTCTGTDNVISTNIGATLLQGWSDITVYKNNELVVYNSDYSLNEILTQDLWLFLSTCCDDDATYWSNLLFIFEGNDWLNKNCQIKYTGYSTVSSYIVLDEEKYQLENFTPTTINLNAQSGNFIKCYISSNGYGSRASLSYNGQEDVIHYTTAKQPAFLPIIKNINISNSSIRFQSGYYDVMEVTQ